MHIEMYKSVNKTIIKQRLISVKCKHNAIFCKAFLVLVGSAKGFTETFYRMTSSVKRFLYQLLVRKVLQKHVTGCHILKKFHDYFLVVQNILQNEIFYPLN